MLRIGILTYHKSKDYGAYLQAYALCSRLNEEKDIKAEIIDYNMKISNDFYNGLYNKKYSLKEKIKKRDYIKFYKELDKSFNKSYKIMTLSPFELCSDSIDAIVEDINERYDMIITGSDEIWKVDGFRGFPTPYWLPFDYKGIKASYAASSRTDLSNVDKEKVDMVHDLISDYKVVSVRDQKTYDEFKKKAKINNKIYLMPDPTLVYEFKDKSYKGKDILASNKKIDHNKKIAVVMTDNKLLVSKIVELYSSEYNIVSVFHYHDNCINIANLNPFEWMAVIAASDFVFATYFHATCFSIINNKKFLVFGVPGKSDKTSEVLKESNNMERFITFDENTTNEEIDKAYKKCLKEKDNSKFLKECRAKFEDYLKIIRKAK